MKELVNLTERPLELDGGIEGGLILAAAGTEGSIKTVEELSDADQLFVARGWIVVRDKQQPLRAVPPQQPQAPKPGEDAAEKIAAADDAKARDKK